MIDENRTNRRSILKASAAAATVALAGCIDGGDDDHHNGDDHDGHDDDHDDHDHDHDHHHELGHPEEHVEVEMTTDDGQHFIPHVVHIEEGGTVEWVLESGSHDTVAYHPDNEDALPSVAPQRIPDGAEPWESDMMSSHGETYEHTFDQEGVYDYVCTPHEAVEMVGRVIVGWPDADGQPALDEPPEGMPDGAREQFEKYNEQTREVLD